MKRLKQQWNLISSRIDRFDVLILFVLLTLYGVFSFSNLGTTKSPQTFFTFQKNQDEIVIEVPKEEQYITSLRYFVGETPGEYRIYTSMDGQVFDQVHTEEEKYVFSWNDIEIGAVTRYIKIEGLTDQSQIGEIQLYQNDNKTMSSVITKGAEEVMDEEDTVPSEISYQNSTYFDEIYFARTAYDYAHGLTAYEWVHPPLGKLIQAIPIYFFGMSPFTFRMMGNISGILLIAVMYLFAKNVFHHRSYALLAAGLMMFDNFHFAQSRMGTIDTHLTLFILLAYWMMYRYIKIKKEEPQKRKYWNLGWCGLFISCAIATKWTGLFAGLGLAIIFFLHFYQTYLKKGMKFDINAKKIIYFCIGFFVALPLTIYVSCYFLFPSVSIFKVDRFDHLVEITKSIFDYHNALKETHPFSSMWYTWPVMLKPVWYYAQAIGTKYQTISGVGNPLIWWSGAIAVIYYVLHFIMHKKKEIPIFMIAIASMFLSYIPIARDMFLYHYFPILPFVMLILVFFIKELQQITKSKAILAPFLILSIVMFFYFYPVTSGVDTTKKDAEKRQWLDTWYF